MSNGRGRKPLWTAKQAKLVLELAAAGMSQRAIAKQVFGDARLNGRVERILGSRTRLEAAAEAEPLDLQSLLPESLEAPELRKLFGFYEQLLKRTGAQPSLAEIERLLRIHTRVRVLAQLERLNALTRDPGLSTEALDSDGE